MLCPACKTDLVMTERQNIEIDYCPKCRGVWLDRGELDKIIERSAKEAPAAAAPPPQAQPQGQPWVQQPQYQPPPQPHYQQQQHHHGHYKKRKSFLEELFD